MSLILSGTDGISDVDGSASTPALRGTDANTGIFFPAADTIAFSEGGVESMRIDSSGNVGIGTSSPAYKLNVVGGSLGISNSSSVPTYFNDAAQTGDSGSTSATRSLMQLSTSGTLSTAGKLLVQGIIHPSVYRMNIDSSTCSGAAAPLSFSTANGATETMRIDSSGNVGIGTSSPNYQLQLYKTGAVANYLQVTSGATGTASGNGTLFGVDASGNGIVTVQGAVNYITSVAGAERMRIDSSGRVGIGISTINQQLAVAGTANATYSSASGMVVNLLGSSTGVVVPIGFSWSGSIGNTSPYWGMGFIPTNFGSGVGDLGFYTNATEKMRILSSGNILCLSGGSTTANGTGIAFPATQSASSDANTLDDYEEGTWTPTDASGASLSLSILDARYTKIGRMVECFAQIGYPSTGNGNAVSVGGLPFTSASTAGGAYGAFIVYTNHTTETTWLVSANATTSQAYKLDGTAFTNANISTKQFRLVWIYEV